MSVQPGTLLTREHQARLEQIVREMSDIIDNLRLSIAYLQFDVEATRRENESLKLLLREKT